MSGEAPWPSPTRAESEVSVALDCIQAIQGTTCTEMGRGRYHGRNAQTQEIQCAAVGEVWVWVLFGCAQNKCWVFLLVSLLKRNPRRVPSKREAHLRVPFSEFKEKPKQQAFVGACLRCMGNIPRRSAPVGMHEARCEYWSSSEFNTDLVFIHFIASFRGLLWPVQTSKG